MGKRNTNPDVAVLLAYFDENPSYCRDWSQTNKKVWAFAHIASKAGEYRSYVGRNGLLYTGTSPGRKSVDSGWHREHCLKKGKEILNIGV